MSAACLLAALLLQLEEMPGQCVFWPLAVSFPHFAGSEKKKKRVHGAISEITAALASGLLLASEGLGRKWRGLGRRGRGVEVSVSCWSFSSPGRLAHTCGEKISHRQRAGGDVWKGTVTGDRAGDTLLLLGGAGENKMRGGEGVRGARWEGTAAGAACSPADQAWHLGKTREIEAGKGEKLMSSSPPPHPPPTSESVIKTLC